MIEAEKQNLFPPFNKPIACHYTPRFSYSPSSSNFFSVLRFASPVIIQHDWHSSQVRSPFIRLMIQTRLASQPTAFGDFPKWVELHMIASADNELSFALCSVTTTKTSRPLGDITTQYWRSESFTVLRKHCVVCSAVTVNHHLLWYPRQRNS
jgi:hypothetical protein